MAEVALAANGLAKRFVSGGETVDVFTDLSLQVHAGESLAIVGRSGSGKSTLLNLLCGLESADAGEVAIHGQPFSLSGSEAASGDQWAEFRRQRLGVLFQEANLMPALTLADNVRLRASLAGQPTDNAIHWLEQMGVGTEAERFPDQVSGGQRQRAALAMVFAMNPAVILADEPTGSLDRYTAEAVADRLFELQQETGCALLLATHDLALANRCHQQLSLGSSGSAQRAS